MERYRIEVGWRDNVRPGTIVGAIANETGVAGRSIGRIHIFDAYSLIDLPRDLSRKDREDLQRLRVRNRELRLTRHSTAQADLP
jgi:ATP-dependent RNA helicase DeaD